MDSAYSGQAGSDRLYQAGRAEMDEAKQAGSGLGGRNKPYGLKNEGLSKQWVQCIAK